MAADRFVMLVERSCAEERRRFIASEISHGDVARLIKSPPGTLSARVYYVAPNKNGSYPAAIAVSPEAQNDEAKTVMLRMATPYAAGHSPEWKVDVVLFEDPASALALRLAGR